MRRLTVVKSRLAGKITIVSLPAPVREVGDSIAERLKAATVAHQDAKEVAERRAAEWRALVVEAIDAGMAQKTVAKLAGVSPPRVHAVVVHESSR